MTINSSENFKNSLILPKINGEYRYNAKITNWFAIDAIAEVLFKPYDLADLQFFLKNYDPSLKINVLGAGSNVIVKDPILNGILIRLGKNFDRIMVEDAIVSNAKIVTIGAGLLCSNVANLVANYGLGGLEFFSGIPGNVGGAIAMNAGCYGGEVADFLQEIVAIDYRGNPEVLTAKQCQFSYRTNRLLQDRNLIVVEAKFLLPVANKIDIVNKIQQLQQQRQESQPIRAKTGGSTFKNPVNSDKKAWQLIDEAGCRGLFCGDAQISEKHCNFLINTNMANAKDILSLINLVKEKVFAKTGINLELEIRIIGN